MKCLKCSNEKFEIKKIWFTPEIKNQLIEVEVPCFVCKNCGSTLMDSAQMNILRRAAADRYRELNSLLTSAQIINYRECLGMSQAAFARHLNVGEASIKRWETYFIQDNSQNDHIKLKCDQLYAETNYLNIYWKYQESDIFSGNKKFSLEFFKQIALYLVTKTHESIIFLNKLHFYVDFYHFKKYGVSITGARYVPLKYGPCPDQYRIIYDSFERNGILKSRENNKYKTQVKPDLTVFNDQERETLEYIYNIYIKHGALYLYELSHKEKGYIDTTECTFINYAHARNLKI